LNTLVTWINGIIIIQILRKPTYNDWYLDFRSHHDKKHKTGTACNLLNQARNLPSTTEAKNNELKNVTRALEENGYPLSIITNILKNKPAVENISSPEELVGMFFKWAEPGVTSFDFACLSYINGVTEPLQRFDFVTMEFELLPHLTELYSKNSLRRNSGHPATSKRTLFIRFPAVTVLGVILLLNDHQIDFDNAAQARVSEQQR